MKNILIMAGTYYPDSMATIGITQRLAEELAAKGYDVSVYTVRYCGHKNPGYPKMYNGVNIYDTDDYKVDKSVFFQMRYRINSICRRIIKKVSKGKTETKNLEKINKLLCKNPREQLLAEVEAKKIEKLISEKKIDTVISVALPFAIHMYASVLKKRNPQLKWIPVSFDPYAYDEVTNAHCKEECISEENRVLRNADKIMFLTQFQNDYKNSVLKDKIEFFELPNIRKMYYDLASERMNYDSNRINCVFLGNLYLIQRHPRFLFELFEGMKNKIITLYIIGDLVDLPKDYIDEWITKFNGRLIYTGRVSQKVAINAMLDADILINIGHATTNQCPSKILDYMSTGKPILSIAKIDNCTSEPYLCRYPKALTLNERDAVTKEMINSAEDFILNSSKDKTLEFEVIQGLYKESTMDCMINKLKSI